MSPPDGMATVVERSAMTGIPSLDQAIDPASVAAAEEVSRRFYARHPEAEERYGAHGRAYTDHDNAYLVQWARDAVALASSAVFERNLRWLLDLLTARDFPAEWFLGDVEIVLDVVTEHGLVAAGDVDTQLRPVVVALRGA
jgi:hypothetical protein